MHGVNSRTHPVGTLTRLHALLRKHGAVTQAWQPGMRATPQEGQMNRDNCAISRSVRVAVNALLLKRLRLAQADAPAPVALAAH